MREHRKKPSPGTTLWVGHTRTPAQKETKLQAINWHQQYCITLKFSELSTGTHSIILNTNKWRNDGQ
jgi:hypothetical protein